MALSPGRREGVLLLLIILLLIIILISVSLLSILMFPYGLRWELLPGERGKRRREGGEDGASLLPPRRKGHIPSF